MGRNVFQQLLSALPCGLARAALGEKNPCPANSLATTPATFTVTAAQLRATEAEAKLASQSTVLVTRRPSRLRVFNPFKAEASDGIAVGTRLSYRIVIEARAEQDTAPRRGLLRADVIASQAASAPVGGKLGTDFFSDKSTVSETLLIFTPRISGTRNKGPTQRRTRLLLVGRHESVNVSHPLLKGWRAMGRASGARSRAIAAACCGPGYRHASTGTFYLRQHQLAAVAGTDSKQSWTGTKFADWWQHLNPVVLTAGNTGLDNPAKLQVLFFSLLAVALVVCIFLLTRHLTQLSNTVLLLMGIFSVGAAAAAGTELSKKRRYFEHWAGFFIRCGLRKGGLAGEKMASWKDIVTAGGQFDATRLQGITFSLLAGAALSTTSAASMDQTTVDILATLTG